MSDKKNPVDWTSLYNEWRMGIASNRQLAEKYGCDEKAIRKRAKRDNWQRDLADAVRRRTQEKLIGKSASPQAADHADHEENCGIEDEETVDDDVSTPAPPAPHPQSTPARSDEELIEEAAELRAAVVHDHTKRSGRLKALADRYMQYIEDWLAPGEDDEAQRKKGVAGGHLFAAKGDNLQAALRAVGDLSERVQKLERQSLRIDGDPNKKEISGPNGAPIQVESKTTIDLSFRSTPLTPLAASACIKGGEMKIAPKVTTDASM